MKTFKFLLKEAREKNGFLVKEIAHKTGIDASLISRFENGDRLPTKKQVIDLATVLDLPIETIMPQWLAEKVLYLIDNEEFGMEGLLAAEEQLKYEVDKSNTASVNNKFDFLLTDIDSLKNKLQVYRKLDSYKIAEALELEYTYESNKIEGNTLTLQETDVVINEGITISGKSMREHLEAINHHDAIGFVKELVQNKNAITETNVLRIHNLVLRGIDATNAGKYRTVQVMIKGSKHLPPQPYLVAKQMEDLFIWYNANKKKLHPVLLAAEMHERLVTIHPFVDGNGRTSRLVMNLILLQHGYVIANIKGDNTSRLTYYNALEKSQTQNDKSAFLALVISVEKECLQQYIKIVGG